MKQKFTLLSWCVLITLYAGAQYNATITGTVINSEKAPVQSATVSLLQSKDSSLVKLAVTDKAGTYEFIEINAGNYLLSVSFVAYENEFSETFTLLKDEKKKLPAVMLSKQVKNLEGVTVQAKVPFVEAKLDRTVINVQASPTNAGATALEVLEKSPGVMVNNDGIISLKGKPDVIIMMDGKRTFLSPTDLATLLRNTPASALDQVEIMTNPSSKFDAAGNSGIINIKTKKGKTDGFNGNFMVGATTSIFRWQGNTYVIPKSQNSVNFNYRKNKLNLFGSYNPNFFKGRGSLEIENRFLDAGKKITGFNNTKAGFKYDNINHTVKLGIDWYANAKNIFGAVVSGFTYSGNSEPVTVADLSDAAGSFESRLASFTDNSRSNKNASLNLNWKHSFDTAGRELTADFDWVQYDNFSDLLLTTRFFNSRLEPTGETLIRGDLPADIKIYIVKSDYTQPLKNGQLDAGFKLSFVRNDNQVIYERFVQDKWVTDVNRTNHFIYDENINAAYVSYNRKIKKLTVQAGLRLENTNVKGNQVVSGITFTRDTTNLFPTAFIQYEVDDKNTFGLNYGRRISRPDYQDLNPFVYFLDTLSFRQGNVMLRPQYTNNIELSHSYKGKLITTLNYNSTNNVISRIIKQQPNSKIRFLTVDNVASFRNIGLSVTTPIKIAHWWNANFFTNIYNNQYKGTFDTFAIDLSFTTFMVNVTNNFTLGKGYSAELSGFYRHRGIDQLAQMEPIYQFSIGAQKQVLQEKGTVRLNIRDPFAWQRYSGLNQYGLVDGNFTFRPDSRQITATFSYRFGTNGQQGPARRRRAASQEEQNRVNTGD